ncbi:MAG TPA: SIMPL domain-containing protein [Propionibacteriaceae bacterium]|nr:SIMPL domain-containing protein [Propionibacteriaceae bacterium]
MSAPTAGPAPDRSSPIVTVRGEAQLEGPPDLATVMVSVHSTSDTAEQARAELAAASSGISGLLQRFVQAVDRSSTTGLHIGPVFDQRSFTRIIGYRGSYSTEIVLADLDALSPLLLEAAALPNGQVSGPWWSLRPDNPLHRQVRLEAITDARRRADDYAFAVRASVSALLEISDVDAGFGGDVGMRSMLAAGAPEAASFDFEPALQRVWGHVVVRYALSPPAA